MFEPVVLFLKLYMYKDVYITHLFYINVITTHTLLPVLLFVLSLYPGNYSMALYTGLCGIMWNGYSTVGFICNMTYLVCPLQMDFQVIFCIFVVNIAGWYVNIACANMCRIIAKSQILVYDCHVFTPSLTGGIISTEEKN